MHNDYAPARGKYEFPSSRPGPPGHTPEHIAWLVYEDGRAVPVAVFGGHLTVGNAGRRDLLGFDVVDDLTRAHFRQLTGLRATTPTQGGVPEWRARCYPRVARL